VISGRTNPSPLCVLSISLNNISYKAFDRCSESLFASITLTNYFFERVAIIAISVAW
jgi:hypothetical protein